MAKLLYIQSSPRKDRSKSNQIADEFIAEYQKNNLADTIATLKIFEEDLPPFDGFTINAKYNIMHGREHSPEEKQAWSVVEGFIADFKSADKYIFSVPMWNFGIPYRLKQYIDIITQPGYTFGVDPEKGYFGMVTDKPALVVFARGGDYSDPEIEKQIDHQKSYLQLLLGFIGFTDIKTITVQPTLADGPEIAEQKTQQAIEQAKTLAKIF